MGIIPGFTWGDRLERHLQHQPKPQRRPDVRGSAVIPDSLGHKRDNTLVGRAAPLHRSGSSLSWGFPVASTSFAWLGSPTVSKKLQVARIRRGLYSRLLWLLGKRRLSLTFQSIPPCGQFVIHRQTVTGTGNAGKSPEIGGVFYCACGAAEYLWIVSRGWEPNRLGARRKLCLPGM